MPPTLVKYHLRQGKYAWTYNFYREAGSPREAVEGAALMNETLMALHDDTTVLEKISASTVAFGVAVPFSKTYNLPGNVRDVNTPPDIVQTTAVMRLYTLGTQTRLLWLRGLPDGSVGRTENGVDLPSANLAQRMISLGMALKERAFQIKSIAATIPGGDSDYKQIVAVEPEDAADPSNSIFQTRNAHGYANGQLVRFSFNQDDEDLISYRGIHKIVENVVGSATTKFVINAKYRGDGAKIIPKKMRVKKVDYDYTNIETGEFVYFRSRDTGGGQTPKGRSKGRSYRH